MGCLVERTDTGVEVDVHVFDRREDAVHYVTVSRLYRFERHAPWGYVGEFDFYTGPSPRARACVRKKDGSWRACFWMKES
jgi:hypothetical protein